MSETILIVEDQPRVVLLIKQVLKAVGYRTITAANGDDAIEQVALEQPDLVILDILMPHGPDGYQVCARIREFSDVPVIMLTAKAQESEILHGFDVGADDYLTKPFNAKELVARIRAVLKRSRQLGGTDTALIKCGDLEIDTARRTVKVAGAAVHLSRTEYALLHQLAQHKNRVMTHRELLHAVWGPEYTDDVDYLRAYIRHLRQKLETAPSEPRYILTSQGVGYVLDCPEP